MSKRRTLFLSTAFVAAFVVVLTCAILFWRVRDMQIALHDRSITFAALHCLSDNRIRSPQSDGQMAQLIYCGSAKGYDYLFMSKGLRLTEDKTTIRNDLFHIDYHVHFDGAYIVVSADNFSSPFIYDTTKDLK